jgi:hypothetical protein
LRGVEGGSQPVRLLTLQANNSGSMLSADATLAQITPGRRQGVRGRVVLKRPVGGWWEPSGDGSLDLAFADLGTVHTFFRLDDGFSARTQAVSDPPAWWSADSPVVSRVAAWQGEQRSSSGARYRLRLQPQRRHAPRRRRR